MKKLLLIIWIIPTITFSQNWHWAKGMKGNGYDMGFDIAVDTSSNIYYAGSFSSDSIVFGTFTLKRNGRDGNAFLVKYDSSGNVLWARSSKLGYAGAHGLTIDNLGNPIITGNYYSPFISFENDTLTQDTTINMNEVASIFLVKYDPLGNVIWAKNTKSKKQDFGNSLAVDKFNNIYVAGVYTSPVVAFDTDTLYNTLSSGGNFFLAKYDPSGSVLWSRSADSSYGNCVAVDSYGNAVATGWYSISTTFGTHHISGLGFENVFLVKYDPVGNVLWVKSEGGSMNNVGNGIATDTHGNFYVTGYFQETTAFGTDTLILNPSGFGNIFIAKYDSSGNVLWAKGPGGIGNNLGYSLTIDNKDNLYLKSGSNAAAIAFDSINLTLPYNGHYYICLTKYDSTGNAVCATALPDGGNEWNRISADASGNLYFGGYYDTTFVIGADTLYKGLGYGNIFISKVGLDCVPTSTCVASIADSLFNISPLNWGILAQYSPQVTNAMWYWGDGTSSAGLYPSHTYSVSGWYTICATAYTFCGDSASICHNDSIYKISSNNSMININVVSGVNAVNAFVNNKSAAIYPNPTTGFFTVQSNTAYEQTVDIYDLKGNHIFSKSIAGTESIDATTFDSGIYTVIIKNNTGATNKKLVIVR